MMEVKIKTLVPVDVRAAQGGRADDLRIPENILELAGLAPRRPPAHAHRNAARRALCLLLFGVVVLVFLVVLFFLFLSCIAFLVTVFGSPPFPRARPPRDGYARRVLAARARYIPSHQRRRARAAKITRDERRWEVAREIYQDTGLTGRYDGLTPIEELFTIDEIAEFDRRLGPPARVEGA